MYTQKENRILVLIKTVFFYLLKHIIFEYKKSIMK